MRSASAAIAAASAGSIGPSVPGGGSTPAARATARALILSPNASSTSGVGPMNTSPSARTALANSAFSLKSPYPGWIARAPVRVAASSTSAMLR
jgi:hypothetical protein